MTAPIFYDQVLIGGAGDDELKGANGDDNIAGNDGNDTLRGGAGNDLILGGHGNDLIHGGNNNDTLYGGRDDDYLIGGQGNDYLSGDRGSDTLDGGIGADIYAFNVRPDWLGDGVDTVLNFTIGQDRFAIVNGSTSLVTFADVNSDGNAEMYYDGTQIAVISGVDASALNANLGSLFV